MKKTAVLLLLIISSFAAKGQDSVVYVPVYYSQQYMYVDFFTQLHSRQELALVDDSGNTYNSEFDGEHIFKYVLPKNKNFSLKYNSRYKNYMHGPVSIFNTHTKDTLILDTIFVETIQPHITIYNKREELSNLFYTDSVTIAQGYQEGIYGNGNLCFKGIFRDGKPIDTLFRYFVDGTIKSKYFSDSAKGIIFSEKYFFNKGHDIQEAEYLNNHTYKKTEIRQRCNTPYKKVVSDSTRKTIYYNVDGKWVNFDGVSLKLTVIGSHTGFGYLYGCEGGMRSPDSTKNGVHFYSKLPPGNYYFDEIHSMGYSGSHPYRNKIMLDNNYNLMLNLTGRDTFVEDTFYTPKIYRTFNSGKPSTMVFNTYDTAYYIDTFYNGQVRFKGLLYKGQPRDTIYMYYPDGSLREVTYFNEETGEMWSKSWYPNGQLCIYAKGIVTDTNSQCLKELYRTENPLEYPLNFTKGDMIDQRDYIPSFCSLVYYRYTMYGDLEFYKYFDNSKMEGFQDSDVTPKGYKYTYVIDSLFNYKYFDRRTGDTEYTLIKKFSKKDKIEDAYYELKIIYENGERDKKIIVKRKAKKLVTKEYKLINNNWVKYSVKREKVLKQKEEEE